jgi:molecular chaperone GrpE
MEITKRQAKTTHVAERSRAVEQAGVIQACESVGDERVAAATQALLEDLERERDARLRLAAEYQNFRRRTERERAHAAQEGKREILTQLVSIVDDIEVALDGSDRSTAPVTEGLRMIHRRFLHVLKRNGVTPFESVGSRFDPNVHHAFDVVTGEDDPGTVLREERRGYLWNDKLLRPALVVVSQ